MNIVKIILDMFGEGALGKLASKLGLSEMQAKSGVTAAVPAMLSALTAKTTEPGGAAAIDRAIDSVSSQSFGEVGDASTGTGASGAQQGTSVLSGLFGGGMLSSLTSGLGRYLGVGEAKISSLLGMVAPAVLGALGKAKSATGMSISNLLASQKDNILSALPSGLGGILKGVPGLGGLMGSVPGVAGAARAATGGLSKVLVPVLVLGALGLGALWFFSSRRDTPEVSRPSLPSVSTPDLPAAPEPSLAAAKLPDVSALTRDLGSTLEKVTRSLEGITDSASAQAALPKLKESLTSIDALEAMIAKVPENARGPITSAIDSARPRLKSLADKALAIPGVGDTLKPTVDSLLAKLDALAGK
jgi:hypothetical protein